MRSGAASLNLIMYFIALLAVTWWVNLQDGLELTPGWALAGRPHGDPGLAGNHTNMTSRTIDIKALFPLYNCKPGRAARVFKRNALQLLSATDARGWSIADCLERRDEGAVQRGEDPYMGAAAPNAPQLPAGGINMAQARALRAKRLKDSAAALLTHLDDEAMKDILSLPPFAQNGPEMFDEIMERCLVPLSALEAQEIRAKILSLSITYDVGFSENTVQELMKIARVENVLLIQTGHAVHDDDMGARCFSEPSLRRTRSLPRRPWRSSTLPLGSHSARPVCDASSSLSRCSPRRVPCLLGTCTACFASSTRSGDTRWRQGTSNAES